MARKKLEELDLSPIGFPGARAQAERFAPGHIGELAWIDSRCQQAGHHALHEWWGEQFAQFYASGKQDFVARCGVRAAKSVSGMRAVVNDALFTMRELDPGVIGIFLIISIDKREASGRLDTIVQILSACGIRNASGENPVTQPGGIGGTYTVRRDGTSGGGEIDTVDALGHAIRFRVIPCRINAVLGCTAIGAFLDEVDAWRDERPISQRAATSDPRKGAANPAGEIIGLAHSRVATQARWAKIYVVSAVYNTESAHSRIVAMGDTPNQYVVKLGTLGADADNRARQYLAAKLESSDPRLLCAADPNSTCCPSWISNPSVGKDGTPQGAIEWCYETSVQDIHIKKLSIRDPIGYMLALYGANPMQIPKVASFTMGLEALTALVRLNQALVGQDFPPTLDGGSGQRGSGLVNRFPGLPSWDPRSLDAVRPWWKKVF